MSDGMTAMSCESHGQCFCGVDVHCGGTVDCTGPGDHIVKDVMCEECWKIIGRGTPADLGDLALVHGMSCPGYPEQEDY